MSNVPNNPLNSVTNMTMDAINAKVRDIIAKAAADLGPKAGPFGPILQEYAPVFARMGQDEVVAWINRALNGSPYEAYKEILAKMDQQGLTDQWSVMREKWKAANRSNVENMAYQQKLAGVLLEAFVSLALATVSL